MRFSVIALSAAVSVCFAQAPSEQVRLKAHTNCAAARIVAPSGNFTMPVVKTPEAKDGVVSTAPACSEAVPQQVTRKVIVVPKTHPVHPGSLQLAPNPFAAPASPPATRPE